MAYFNTTNLEGQELKDEVINCSNQEQRILDLMLTSVGYTPFCVARRYKIKFKEVPITSIRRAMCCLTEKGLLTKTDMMMQGIYGKPNHLWVKK